MPVIYSDTVLDWGTQAIAHMRNVSGPLRGDDGQVHPCRVDWPLPSLCSIGDGPSLVCSRCNVWFTLRSNNVLLETDPSTRIVADFLRSPFGRKQLLEYLLSKGAQGLQPGEHPFDPDAEPQPEPEARETAWSKILSEDDYE